MSTYNELLLDERWKSKRNEIVARDRLVCQHCKNLSLQREFKHSQSLRHEGIDNDYRFYLVDAKETAAYLQTVTIQKSALLPGHENLPKYSMVYYRLDEEARKLVAVAVREYDKREITGYGKTPIVIYPLPANSVGLKWRYNRTLNVHHLYYQHGLNPWEYRDDALKTLCRSCHEEVHRNQTIPVKDKKGNVIGKMTPCSRCHGAGVFPQYFHVQFGICFRCLGHQYEELVPF